MLARVPVLAETGIEGGGALSADSRICLPEGAHLFCSHSLGQVRWAHLASQGQAGVVTPYAKLGAGSRYQGDHSHKGGHLKAL